MKRIAIMAGNHAQATLHYPQIRAHHKDLEMLPNYFYISNPGVTLGIDYDDYRIVGTFWDRHDATDIYSAVHLRLRTRRGTPTPRKELPMGQQHSKTGIMARFTVANTGAESWLSGVTFTNATRHIERDKASGAVFATASDAAQAIAQHASRFNRPRCPDRIFPGGDFGWWDIIEITTVSTTTERTV